MRFFRISSLILLFLLTPIQASGVPQESEATTIQLQEYSAAELSADFIVSRIGEWGSVPNIRICKNAPVTEEQVRKAIEWWSVRGYRFGEVTPDTVDFGCLFGEQSGSILIELASGESYDEKYIATTLIYHTLLDEDVENIEVFSARIRMKGDIRERVLEHELGHALGFLHYNRTGHLMNEEWLFGGWNDRGLLSN